MHDDRLGLRTDPFRIGSASSVFRQGAFIAACNEIGRTLVDGGRLAMLVAAPGLGKTAALRHVATALQDSGMDVTLLDCTSWRDVAEIGASMKPALPGDTSPVLMLDNAQDLAPDVLHATLRQAAAGGSAMLLAGEPGIEAAVSASLAATPDADRPVVRRLWPLSDDEVARYVADRLVAAGCPRGDLFTPDALAAVATAAAGVPKQVNRVCSAALALATHSAGAGTAEARRIGADHVAAAVRSLDIAAVSRAGAADTSEPPVPAIAPPSRLAIAAAPRRRRGFDRWTALAAAGCLLMAVGLFTLYWYPDRPVRDTAARDDTRPTSPDAPAAAPPADAARPPASAIFAAMLASYANPPLARSAPDEPARQAAADDGGIRHLAVATVPRGDRTALPAPATAADAVREQDVVALLARATAQSEALRLTTPPGDNARETYMSILSFAPGHAGATAGLRALALRYVGLSLAASRQGASDKAELYARKAEELAPDDERVRDLMEQRRQAVIVPSAGPEEPLTAAGEPEKTADVAQSGPVQLLHRRRLDP